LREVYAISLEFKCSDAEFELCELQLIDLEFFQFELFGGFHFVRQSA
jgi:hypothetical protein